MSNKDVRLVRSNHKDKHANETWNQDSVPIGMLNGKLVLVESAEGKTADLFVFAVRGLGTLVGLIVSKIRVSQDDGKRERVIITAFEENVDGYWMSEIEKFKKDTGS